MQPSLLSGPLYLPPERSSLPLFLEGSSVYMLGVTCHCLLPLLMWTLVLFRSLPIFNMLISPLSHETQASRCYISLFKHVTMKETGEDIPSSSHSFATGKQTYSDHQG
jgi:hypothetical protein